MYKLLISTNELIISKYKESGTVFKNKLSK